MTVIVYIMLSHDKTGLDIDCLVMPKLGYHATTPVTAAVFGLVPVSVNPHSRANVAVLVKIVPAV